MKIKLNLLRLCTIIFFLLGMVNIGFTADYGKFITMSTTTSTQASGLLDVLLPEFEKDTGIKIKVIAKGTGAAIRDGMDGNVDIIFVHAIEREKEFVKEGYGTKRYAVMHNDFIIIGPKSDPAHIGKIKESNKALKKIARKKALFISRGDDSGTHTKEQELWKESKIRLENKTTEIFKDGKSVSISSVIPKNSGRWYISIGQGMGKTIAYADEKQAYTIADRGTYIKYKYGKTPAVDLDILCEGDSGLSNPYGLIPVNPKKFPHVKYELAMDFVNWIMSEKGQRLIGDYNLIGKQLFFPDALR